MVDATVTGYFLRLPADLKAALMRLASIEDRTTNAQIVRVLREWVAAQDRDPKLRP